METQHIDTEVQQARKALRARFLEARKKYPSGQEARALYLVYAFLRGVPYEALEARVSEHNRPHHSGVIGWIIAQYDILTVRADPTMSSAPRPEWVANFQTSFKTWSELPETRIKRYPSPRVPKPRKTDVAKKAAELRRS